MASSELQPAWIDAAALAYAASVVSPKPIATSNSETPAESGSARCAVSATLPLVAVRKWTVHGEVLADVLPAVGRADESRRSFRERHRNDDRLRLARLPRVERGVRRTDRGLRVDRGERVVVHRRVGDHRLMKEVELQPRHLARDLEVLKHDVAIRIGENRPLDHEAPGAVRVGDVERRNARLQPLDP